MQNKEINKQELIRQLVTELRPHFGLQAEEIARNSVVQWNVRGKCTVNTSTSAGSIPLEVYDNLFTNKTMAVNELPEPVRYDRISVARYIAEQVRQKAVSGVDLNALTDPEGQSKFFLIWDAAGTCRVYITCDINHHFSIPILNGRFNNYSTPLSLVPLDIIE
ncbi:hypothetical protein KFS98_003631 [Salmonella enterica]|nr:hypothetical protein [Salmonella enterica]